MLCVFFRRCVSGNPPNCFGVFFSVLLALGFLCGGFPGTNSCAGVWGGAYPVSFACYLGGNAVRFSAARFSGDLGYVFQKFAPKIFFQTLLGKIFGCELVLNVLGTFYRALSWIPIWKSLQLLPEKPRGKKFSFA